MALNPPSNVDFVVASPTTGTVSWENNDEYMFVELWENNDGEGYALKYRLAGTTTSKFISGLEPEEVYCYKVRGIGPPPAEEESAFSAEDCETMYAELQAPTDIVTTVFSDFVEITFKDNSSAEDSFRIERKLGAGAFGEIGDVARNMEYYRDTTVVAGNLYTYRVRAKEDPANFSAYVTGSQITANNIPDNPTGATISEVTDEEMRVTWVAPAAGFEVTGYKVQISDTGAFGGEEVEYVVANDVFDFFFKDLTPSQQYWVRIYSYNGVGDSAGNSADNDTCLAARVRTDFEVFVRDPSVEPVYIAEIDMKMDLSGFDPTAGEAPVYDIEIDERGLEIDSVWEDGTALTEKASVAQVKALAGSWWWDTSIRKLYVRSSTDADPDDFFMEGGFVHLIPSKDFTYADSLCTLPPWLLEQNIPGVTQEIKSYYEGSFRLSTGSISFVNTLSVGEYYFDKRFETFTWIGSKLTLYCGKDSFSALSSFKKMFTAFISDKSIDDKGITFSLSDIREGLERDLVLNTYSITEYPGMDEDFEGKEKFKAWGSIEELVPVLIKAYNAAADVQESAKFSYHDPASRTLEVAGVKVNGVIKVLDTDYYVDSQRSIITFDAGVEVKPEDIVLVSFVGQVDSANEAIVNGADVFKHIMNGEANLATVELQTDWLYETKYANTKSLSVPVYKDTNFNEIIKTIEHSTEAYITQDGAGKIGLRPLQATVTSKAKYIWNFQSRGHKHRKNRNSLYWKVKVYYNENVQTQEWAVAEAENADIKWKFKKEWIKELPVYCYFQATANAESLATAILSLLNKTFIVDKLPMILFDVFPGDLVPFSRTRFFDSSGTADEVSLRILKIEKNPQNGVTSVTMGKV